MITWDSFLYFALPAMVLWAASVLVLYGRKKKSAAVSGSNGDGSVKVLTDKQFSVLSAWLTLAGVAVFGVFIALMWISMERPPMRTMGETRLWYTFFLSAIGLVMYLKWKHHWILSFSLVVASVFIIINIAKPEIQSKDLMPALQSIWFVPHVISYILSYAFLSAATIAAIILLYQKDLADRSLVRLLDNVVYIGFGLLMVGLLLGAVWAKEAWGHYWSWDPKETWAFITAAGYLIFIHLRLRETKIHRLTLWIVIFSFVLLMITWKGVNYLPAAQGSIHVYSNE
jgi:ABC-type transport system involved in cytochrome c biogenesis permease subunit